MNTASLRFPWSARVYTIVVVLILAVTLATAAAPAPMGITIEPGLSKGPADAPVTLVEFSDYQ